MEQLKERYERTVISLFGGIGGLDLGFELEGFQTLFMIDYEKTACQIYDRFFNSDGNIDIRQMKIEDFDLSELPPASLVIGGYPCQGFSSAGPRKSDDPRNKLYLEFAKVVEYVEPLFFVAENVPGTKQYFKGQFFDDMVQEFSALCDNSYTVYYGHLIASDFGVPQDRERIIFVGVHKRVFESDPKWRNYDNHLFFKKIHSFYETERKTLGQCLQPIFGRVFKAGMDYYDFHNNSQPWHFRSRNRKKTLTEASYTILASERAMVLHPSGKRMKKHPSTDDRFIYDWIISPDVALLDENRPLSWQEAATIQGFPPNYISILEKTREEYKIPLDKLYRGIGNAVPPPMAQAVARMISTWSGWDSKELTIQKKKKIRKTTQRQSNNKNLPLEELHHISHSMKHLINGESNGFEVFIPPFDVNGYFYYTCKGCNNIYNLATLLKKRFSAPVCSSKCLEWYIFDQIEEMITQRITVLKLPRKTQKKTLVFNIDNSEIKLKATLELELPEQKFYFFYYDNAAIEQPYYVFETAFGLDFVITPKIISFMPEFSEFVVNQSKMSLVLQRSTVEFI